MAGLLVGRQLFAQVRACGGFVKAGAGRQLDKGDDLFVAVLLGAADHGAALHAG
ncbi:hypothetical protein D3C72_2408330 [compost metagenome]